MANVRLMCLLVALCVLSLLGCLRIRPGYVHVRISWSEFPDIVEVEAEDSIPFGAVALVRPPVSEKMALVFVICEDRFDLGIVAVKSAVAYSTTRLHLIIIADNKNQKRMWREYSSWPDIIKRRVSCDVKRPWFPKKNYDQWRGMFKTCSTQRLFLPSMFPNEDAVLVVDTDVVFIHPVEDLWRKFYAMNEWQMVGMAHETEDYGKNYYLKWGLHPFPPPFGLNAGLLLMNLTRMRAFDLESRVTELKDKYEGRVPWGDQDLLNILYARHPQGVFTFTCRWNYRGEHCYGDALCTDGPIAVLHASRQLIPIEAEPAFVAVHRSMQEFPLGGSLVNDFIAPLNKSLLTARSTGCTKELTKQLSLFRLSASRVDDITVQAAATRTA